MFTQPISKFSLFLAAVLTCGLFCLSINVQADEIHWNDQGEGLEQGQNAEGNQTTTIHHSPSQGGGKTITTHEKETGIPKHRQSFNNQDELQWEEFYDTEDGFTKRITYPGGVETTYINRDIREWRGDYEDEKNQAEMWDEFWGQIDNGVQGIVDQFKDFISGGSLGIKKPSGDKAPKLDPNPPWGVYDPSEFESSPVQDAKPKNMPKSDPKSQPWGFLPEYDLNNKSLPPAQDADPMPLADPEPIVPEPNPESSSLELDKPGSSFGGPVSEPEPKDVDYKQYGDKVAFDASRGITSIINSSTGTITEIHPHPYTFGEMYGGTIAMTSLNGKVIHKDYYSGNGRLTESIAIDPTTGIQTITKFNRDGTQTVTRVNADGSPVIQKASTTDKDGNTTTSEGNANGTRTVTVTDKDGNVIGQETKGKDSEVLIEGFATDPKTGITRTGKKLADGTTEITITDKNGKLISQSNSRPASDSFSRFDALRQGPMGKVWDAMNHTPTAVLDGGPARNMGGETGAIAMGSQGNHSYDSYTD